jgi:hypothetical protein
METTKTEEQFCPYCGHVVDAHSTDQGTPSPGDLSICFYCGEIMRFSEYLSLLKCNVEELNLDSSAIYEINRIQDLIKKHHGKDNHDS